MDERCVLVEDLGELPDLSPDDPRMVHVAGCPRCQGRLLAYREFMSRDHVLEGAREDEADGRLLEFLEETIRGRREVGEAHEVPGASSEPLRRPRTDPFRRLRELARSRRIFWLSFATLAVVSAVLAVVLLRGPGEPPRIVPRGEEAVPGQTAPLPAPAEWLPGGGCLLRWSGVREADAYRVLMLDAGLAEVGRLEATRETSFILDSGRVRGLQSDRRPAYWQVEALYQGDVIAASPPQLWVPRDR